MPTPTRSWAQTWGRMPAAAQAWIMGVVGKQLRNLTPSCFKMVAIASTIFMGCPPYLRRSRWPHVAEEILLRPGLRQGPYGDYRRRDHWSRGRGAWACGAEIDTWAVSGETARERRCTAAQRTGTLVAFCPFSPCHRPSSCFSA